jgi:hypothetical protein
MADPRRLAKLAASALVATFHVSLAVGAGAQAPPTSPGVASPEGTPPAPPAPLGVSGSLSNSLVLRGNPSQSTLLTVLSAAYQLTPAISTFGRIGTAANASSDVGSATDVANPAVGLNLQLDVGKHVKVGGTSGVTIPIGTGAGDSASAGAFRAWTNSVDWGGAMFAVDHLDIFDGVRAAYVLDSLTVSFESILHALIRVRGAVSDPIGSEATVTGTTLAVAYAFFPQLTLSTSLSETRFLNTPLYIQQSPESRVEYFFSAGASTTMKIGSFEVDPGLVYARALDMPLTAQNFQVVELDLGFAL